MVNSDLGNQLWMEKVQSIQRLEQLIKEQQGKMEQLREENELAHQQITNLKVNYSLSVS